MKCSVIDAREILKRGVEFVVECLNIDTEYTDISDLARKVKNTLHDHIVKSGKWRLEFISNEVVGTDYLLFKYHVYPSTSGRYISVRVVTHAKNILHVIATVDKELVEYIKGLPRVTYRNYVLPNSVGTSSNIIYGEPPGQKYIPYFIIYRVFGQPEIPEKYMLKITGLVKRQLVYSYEELLEIPMTSYTSSFHCVTGWSIREVLWKGIPLRKLVEPASILPGAKWVFIRSLDEYTTIIPLEDFLHDKALLVLKINNKPLPLEQGFPARIFIPHLYGWKSAKWVE